MTSLAHARYYGHLAFKAWTTGCMYVYWKLPSGLLCIEHRLRSTRGTIHNAICDHGRLLGSGTQSVNSVVPIPSYNANSFLSLSLSLLRGMTSLAHARYYGHLAFKAWTTQLCSAHFCISLLVVRMSHSQMAQHVYDKMSNRNTYNLSR